MALSVFAAFLSCFFSLVAFLTFVAAPTTPASWCWARRPAAPERVEALEAEPLWRKENHIKLLSLAEKWIALTCATAPRLPGPWFGAVAARSSCFGTSFVSSGSREMSSCGPATEEDPEPLEAAEFLFLAPATPPTCFLRQGEGEKDWLPWPPPPPPDRPWLR